MAKRFHLQSETLLHREVAELETLYEIARILSESLQIHQSLEEAFQFLAKNMGLARVVLVLYDEERERLTHFASLGLTEEEKLRAVYQPGEGITGSVFATGTPQVIPDIRQDPRFLNRTQARAVDGSHISFICVPVTVKNVRVGALCVDRVKGLYPELEEDVRLLTIVASLVGQSVSLYQRVEKTIEELKLEKQALQAELGRKFSFPNFSGETPAVKEVLTLVGKVAGVDATVFLFGESGTGKDLLAHIVHFQSSRKEKPFVKVDCGTIPSHLIESELFGFVKGAFTGASFSRRGKLEEAHTGTLFLDEIGNLPLEAQTKLLRFLQERVIYRLGSNEPILLDVRIIAATNEDLAARVKDRSFRQDLFYRLNVFPIRVAPLRERIEDVPLLARMFVEKNRQALKKDVKVTEEALQALMQYDFPGNVRELENFMLRLCILKEAGGTIQREDVLALLPAREESGVESQAGLRGATQEAEREAILKALEEANQVKSRAAALLGISDRALRYKLKKLGLS